MGLKVTHVEEAKIAPKKLLEAGKKPKDFVFTTDAKGSTASSLTGALESSGKSYKIATNYCNSFNAVDLRQAAAFMNELADTLAA